MRFSRWLPKAWRHSKSRPHVPDDRIKIRFIFRRAEELEARDVPAVFSPSILLHSTHSGATPFGSTGPTGLSPAQIRHAYGFDQIAFGNTAGTGAGTTIAIVDAYDDPSIQSDLHAFDVQFGLSDPTFTKVNQSGGTTMPAANTGWAGEISLDVEWAHAVAPGANILLVEANDSSDTNLYSAVAYAARQPGVVAVSMSWGGSEYSGESGDDGTFVTPAGHTGVVFLASSGDSGAPVSYPAASPNVLSVGGTTLSLTAGNYASETGWGGSGGGISAYESQPAYQKGVVTQSTTKRTNPDVAYDADPNTGFSVYQTYGNSTTAPWLQYGGTSDAAPQWAALVAIADQGRALAGEAALSSATLLPMIYQLPAADFHDVSSGTSTGSPRYSAGSGYDLVTGRGTPVANHVVADLVGTSPAPAATHFSISGPTAATAGAGFTVTVTALDANNQPVAGYTGAVHFTSSDATAVLPADYTFTASDAGTHSFTVTLKAAGTQSVTVTDKTTTTLAATTSVSVSNPGPAATHFSFSAPTAATAGAGFTVTVTALDANNQVVAGYTGTVHLTSSDASAVLPADYTFTASDAGTHSFTVTLKAAGTQSVTVTDKTTATLAATTAVSVSAAAASQFQLAGFSSAVTAGTAGTFTVSAVDAYGNPVTGYTGTVHFTSSDPKAVLPADTTLTGGKGTFSATFVTAGTESLTATDTVTSSSTGTLAGISVLPGAATHLVFLQQPSSAATGAAITPVVKVALMDQYNNVVTTDNTDKVTLVLGSNPSGATLSGNTVAVAQGVAMFTSLSVSAAGTGYTLVGSSGTLTGATSATFNVTAAASGATLEGFESGLGNYWYTGYSYPYARTSTAAAHDGAYGFDDVGDGDWYFRTDAAAQINPGDTVSVWVKFAGAADGRAYFGFGTGTNGTLSVVLAPNSGQLLIQNNAGFGYTDLAAVRQSYVANQWYRVEVSWGTSGTVVAKVFSSNGTTLLNTVTAATGDVTPGGFAFRSTGHDKYFDTVTVTRGGNSFVAHAAATSATPTGGTGTHVSHTTSPASPAIWWAGSPVTGWPGLGTAIPTEVRTRGSSDALASGAAGISIYLGKEWFVDVG